jgi:hypothetical protein
VTDCRYQPESSAVEMSMSKKSRKKRDRKKNKANHGRRPNS